MELNPAAIYTKRRGITTTTTTTITITITITNYYYYYRVTTITITTTITINLPPLIRTPPYNLTSLGGFLMRGVIVGWVPTPYPPPNKMTPPPHNRFEMPLPLCQSHF